MVVGASNGAEWVTAFGTIAVAIAAVGVAAAPAIRSWWRKPKLSFVFGTSEPYARAALAPDRGGMDAVLLRRQGQELRRSEARRVRGQVREWWVLKTDASADRPWVERDIDPIALAWVGTPEELVDIPSGASGFLEVARLDVRQARLFLRAFYSDHVRGEDLAEPLYAMSEHRLEVVVSAENADFVFGVFRFCVSQDHFFQEVEESTRPEDSEVEHSGLLGMLGTGG